MNKISLNTDDSHSDPLARFLTEHADDLRRGGSIVNSWRTRDGKVFGPYHRLTCRDAEGRQRSVYLPNDQVISRARAALAALQAPRQQARQLAYAGQLLRRGDRLARATLREQLLPLGLSLKGREIRGLSRLKKPPPRRPPE